MSDVWGVWGLGQGVEDPLPALWTNRLTDGQTHVKTLPSRNSVINPGIIMILCTTTENITNNNNS